MFFKPRLSFLFVLASNTVLVNQCFSANSNAPKENFQKCCSAAPSGSGVVGGYDFDYTCNKYPSTSDKGERGLKTAQACAEHCATDPYCKASAWKASSKLCAKVTANSFNAVNGDGWLLLEKNAILDKLSEDDFAECQKGEAACNEKVLECERTWPHASPARKSHCRKK